MNTRPKNQAISNTLKKALHAGLITGEDSAIIFYDLSMLIDRIKHIKDIFPENTLHAIAVKANPLIKILKMLNTEGTGLETASLPEVYLAREAGFDASRIVFDSPAKTEHELKIALEMGVNINIDSFQELDRVAKLVTQYPQHGIIGLRINPQVGLGKIKSSSVAGEYSKFGVPLKEFREEIISSYKKYSWLNGIHLHVGSQGCPIEMLVEGVKRVYDLAMEINTLVGSQDLIKVFDMGGGLPVSYHFDAPSTDPRDYIDMLSTACPSLFDGTFSLVTEFGRYASANAGWTASRVEYVKESKDRKTAIIHVGADMLLRRCFLPDDWYFELSVFDHNGTLKKGSDPCPYTIAGPLCFSGDMIADGISLPVMNPNDFLVIHDTGAYTLCMWSRYNSRQIPKVVGYYNQGDELVVLRNREDVADLVNFWK